MHLQYTDDNKITNDFAAWETYENPSFRILDNIFHLARKLERNLSRCLHCINIYGSQAMLIRPHVCMSSGGEKRHSETPFRSLSLLRWLVSSGDDLIYNRLERAGSGGSWGHQELIPPPSPTKTERQEEQENSDDDLYFFTPHP